MTDLDQLSVVGSGLRRPECALARADGTLRAADWRGGVTVIGADTAVTAVLAAGDFRPSPNGIAIGGPDMKTVYLGGLPGDSIAAFRTDQAGLAPRHWNP